MKIRSLKKKDCKQLLDLFRELTTNPVNFQIDEVIGDNNCHTIVIENTSGYIIGFAALTTFLVPTKGRVGKVEDVVVARKFRGRGLGDKLMDEIIEIAKKQNLKNITLTSNPKRHIARNLYAKKGFVLLETGVFLLTL